MDHLLTTEIARTRMAERLDEADPSTTPGRLRPARVVGARARRRAGWLRRLRAGT